ncbi:MAG: hypothetical protein ABI723_16545 [Bacteroidia bacterium]
MNIKLSLIFFLMILKIIVVSAQNDSLLVKKTKSFRGNEFLITLGLNFPVGGYHRNVDYSGTKDIPGQTRDNLSGKDGGFGAKAGGLFDLSCFYAFKKGKSYSKYGLKVTFLNYTTNKFKWEQSGYIFNDADYKKVKTIAIKIGPSVRLPLKKKTNFIRFYYQLCPTHAWNGGWHYSHDNNSYGVIHVDNAYFELNK